MHLLAHLMEDQAACAACSGCVLRRGYERLVYFFPSRCNYFPLSLLSRFMQYEHGTNMTEHGCQKSSSILCLLHSACFLTFLGKAQVVKQSREAVLETQGSTLRDGRLLRRCGAGQELCLCGGDGWELVLVLSSSQAIGGFVEGSCCRGLTEVVWVCPWGSLWCPLCCHLHVWACIQGWQVSSCQLHRSSFSKELLSGALAQTARQTPVSLPVCFPSRKLKLALGWRSKLCLTQDACGLLWVKAPSVRAREVLWGTHRRNTDLWAASPAAFLEVGLWSPCLKQHLAVFRQYWQTHRWKSAWLIVPTSAGMSDRQEECSGDLHWSWPGCVGCPSAARLGCSKSLHVKVKAPHGAGGAAGDTSKGWLQPAPY